MDLPVAERPPAGGRHRRRRPAAVPLPPATGAAGGTRRSSSGCCVRQGAVEGARAGAHRPRRRGDDAGARLRGRRTAARPGLLPDRQRRLRRGATAASGSPRSAAARAQAAGRLVFCFTGKSGVEHCITIDDPATSRRWSDAAPPRAATTGCWRGRTGRLARARPGRVNDYVRETTGIEATAKDFRTWHATVIAAAALAETAEPGETKASRKRAVSRR